MHPPVEKEVLTMMPAVYKQLYELGEKYFDSPVRKKIIADLMAYAFTHNHELPMDYLFLDSNYSNEDIALIFDELNIPFKCAMGCPARTIQLKAVWCASNNSAK